MTQDWLQIVIHLQQYYTLQPEGELRLEIELQPPHLSALDPNISSKTPPMVRQDKALLNNQITCYKMLYPWAEALYLTLNPEILHWS